MFHLMIYSTHFNYDYMGNRHMDKNHLDKRGSILSDSGWGQNVLCAHIH